MELYQGLILGVVQGLTEFLPVSSSGHLVLGQIFFGLTESQLSFDISVHVGTLLAVIAVYFSDISSMLGAVLRFLSKAVQFKPVAGLCREDENLRLAGLIVLGSIPTAAIGLFLKKFEQFLFSSEILVGCMLIVTGSFLWLTRSFYSRNTRSKELGILQALLIGTTQGLAVIPGISRSGATISAGMFLGLDRHLAAKFSFLLCIPAILGAALLDIKDMMKTGFSFDPVILYATIASFITGLIALKILLRLVHTGKFHLFAPYCWLVGILVLLSNFI